MRQWPNMSACGPATPVMATTERRGGSRAQRDLLELTYASLLLRLGHRDEAACMLHTRRAMLAQPVPLAGLA